MKELISVIIPIYNKQETIERCIKSVSNQEYQNIEIIIVNDGSTDNSLSICRKYEKIDNRIHLYNKENKGVSSARNYGLNKSNGKYIFFIDADDTIEPLTLKKLMLKVIDDNNNNILVGGNFKKVVNNKAIKLYNYGNKIFSKEEIIKEILENKIHGGVCNYLFNKEKIRKLEFDTNTSYMEDTIFLIKYLKGIDEIEFIENDESYYNYYAEIDNSLTNNKNKVIKNIYDFIYSLDEIDKITNEDYHDNIIKKKIILIEKEARNISNIEGYNNFLNDNKIKETIKAGKGYYTKLYKLNNPYILNMYYQIRYIIKKQKNLKFNL